MSRRMLLPTLALTLVLALALVGLAGRGFWSGAETPAGVGSDVSSSAAGADGVAGESGAASAVGAAGDADGDGAAGEAGAAGAAGEVGATRAADSAAGRYTIVATIGMVTDIVRAVAGDRAEVIGLIGSGIDPHLYRPTRSDVGRLMDADVIFYNGLLLEGKMTDSLIRAATAGKKVHAVTELLDEQFLLEPEEFQGLFDPHVWMDPSAWARAVEVVEAKLSEFDPAGAGVYAENAAAYGARLAELDAYAESILQTVPEGRRVLVTAHDAFNYFGRRFGYEVVGIQGISTESEAGVQDIERLVDLLVERKVGAVFVESTVSERNIRALVAGAQARGHTVVVGGQLFSDAMGAEGTYEGTYLGMIDHNATVVARSLGGESPARGMEGKLAL